MTVVRPQLDVFLARHRAGKRDWLVRTVMDAGKTCSALAECAQWRLDDPASLWGAFQELTAPQTEHGKWSLELLRGSSLPALSRYLVFCPALCLSQNTGDACCLSSCE
jgi:hypothetical protein